jgi:hypothetical protein
MPLILMFVGFGSVAVFSKLWPSRPISNDYCLNLTRNPELFVIPFIIIHQV